MMNSVTSYIEIIQRNTDLDKFLVAKLFRDFAHALLGVFIPLFLYEQGVGIPSIIGFFILECAWFVILAPILSTFIANQGFVRSLLLSFPLNFVYFLLIPYVTNTLLLFLTIPILRGISRVISNVSLHGIFLEDVDEDKEGKEISLFSSVGILSGLLAPAIGGLVAGIWSYTGLFLIGAFGFIFAAIPLLSIADKQRIDQNNIRRRIRNQLHITKNTVSLGGYAVSKSIDTVIYPVFLFVTISSVEAFGFVLTVASIVSFFIMYAVGVKADQGANRALLRNTNKAYTLAFALRIFLYNPLSAVILEAFKNVSFRALYVPWNTEMVRHAERTDTYAFLIAREIVYNMARILALPVIAVVFIYATPYKAMILVGAVLTWFYQYFHAQPKKVTV